jgi:hypothetical protein
MFCFLEPFGSPVALVGSGTFRVDAGDHVSFL